MDQIKASTGQFARVTPTQSGAKQRDEGFIASRVDSVKDKADAPMAKKSEVHASQGDNTADSRNNTLVEQRKRDLAEQVSAKENARELIERAEELSAQRQLESRAAANKQKIRDSYDAVQQNNNQQQSAALRAERDSSSNSMMDSAHHPMAEAINLVV